MTKRRKTRQLAFLYEAARTISAELNTGEVLQKLMSLTHNHFAPDAVSVAQVEPDGALLFRAASGRSAAQIIGMRLAPGTGIAGWVAARGEAIWVPNVYADARFYVATDARTGFQTQAILAVPVKLGAQTLAILEMINPGPQVDPAEAAEVLAALAALAAPAIQNAHLFEQVHRAEARYQSLFELNLDPLLILERAGHLLEFNQAAGRLLGLTPAERGARLLDRLELTEERLAELVAQADQGCVSSWEFKCHACPAEADENQRTFEINFCALENYSPHRVVYQWLAHDITDRVALEEMRQQFSNMIVHDLRVPLSTIVNNLQLVLETWPEQDANIPLDQVLRIALRSANRMERLISDILDTARLQSQEKTIAVAAIEIPELVEEVVDTIRTALEQRRHTLTLNLPSALPPLHGDSDLLRRVLLNVLDNAAKYSGNDNAITLAVTADAEGILFAIGDSGPGIPPQEQENLFKLFWRGPHPQTKGAGIGLTFCKLAVEAHGGRIWLESGEGQGTTVYFAIPRRAGED